MASKVILVCVSAFLVQCISGQFMLTCGPPVYDYGCGSTLYDFDGLSYGYGAPPCGFGSSLYGYDGLSYGYGTPYGCGCSIGSLNSNAATLISGGNLIVTCYSPNAATGVVVASELALAGNLEVIGAMPFLSTVGFQNQLPTYGAGYVDYSCGSACNTITSV